MPYVNASFMRRLQRLGPDIRWWDAKPPAHPFPGADTYCIRPNAIPPSSPQLASRFSAAVKKTQWAIPKMISMRGFFILDAC